MQVYQSSCVTCLGMSDHTGGAECCCRYKHEIRKEDKEALRKLIKVQYHYQVSSEITRELDASRCG